jgi:hypothetical protein
MQHLLLSFRGQSVEALQALLQLLLPVRRQTAKCRIILQSPPLLIQRLSTILV